MTRLASELLRELDERMTAPPWRPMRLTHRATTLRAKRGPHLSAPVPQAQNFPDVAALRNALPALTAAIEAAEAAVVLLEIEDREDDLDAALAALSAALTEGDA